MKKQEIIRDLMQSVRKLDEERTNANYECFATRIDNLMLKQQLIEKDIEIKKLEDFHDWEKEMIVCGLCELLKEKETETRHQVCEEIGQALNEYIDTHRWKWENKGRHEIVKIPNCIIREILRKIEKGESEND